MNAGGGAVDLDVKVQEKKEMAFSPVLTDSEFQYQQKQFDERVSNFEDKIVPMQ